ncbi:MAG: TIGR00725 family protein [Desulfococcaceae bacterium]
MKNNTVIVGVMGGGNVSPEEREMAYNLGKHIAGQGWILLNGGRKAGIMDASAKGAFESGGLTLGILPDDHYDQMSEYIRIPVLTGMGSARNAINVLSSHVVVACPGGSGTVSEVALALKNRRPVILFRSDMGRLFDEYAEKGLLFYADTPEKVISLIKEIVGKEPM